MAKRTQKPRVLLAADSLEQKASGIARVARLMARVLHEEACAGRLEVQALVLKDAKPAQDLGLAVRTAAGSRLRFVAGVQHAALTHSHFLYDFAGIARAHPRCGPLRRPHLVWIHGIEVWEQAEGKRVARARTADVLLANSEYTRRRAAQLHSGLDHAEVCWLATESDVPAPALAPAGERAPIVMVLSRLDEGGGYKGHRELIASWPAVVARVPTARLRIVGDGPGAASVKAWVATSPVREQIDMLGHVPELELPRLFASARVFAMPSRGEGFGLVYAEAMRYATPVIGSVHDAAVEVNVDGMTGYNVDLSREDELAQRTAALLTDAQTANAMGAAGQQRWHDQLRYERFAARFRPQLARLLALDS